MTATRIYRIAVDKVVPCQDADDGTWHLRRTQVLTVRIAAESQEEAEQVGRLVWTTWLRQHPGVPATMRTAWPTSHELGEDVSLKPLHEAY